MPKRAFSIRKQTSWPLIAFLVLGAILLITLRRSSPDAVSYSELRAAIADGQVDEAYVSKDVVRAKLKSNREVETLRVEDPDLVRDLLKANAKVHGATDAKMWDSLMLWLPWVLFIAGWVWLNRRMAGGGRAGMPFGQSKAKLYAESDVKATFADVAGVDEAKNELREVIDFLCTPDKFRRLGGRMPKGILLVGPPGTGKTLLARAVAGEAKVPFFSISGSEFVELFVGVGAARVRDLFLQAKAQSPCIIFIDELDALGKVRGVGPMAHEEREQTLNQLLVELDGFDPREGVVLMAATNRPEILDPALLRAGRFDRHVLVDRPDRVGRLAILGVHARKIKLAPKTSLDAIAAMTVGMVGADLANVVNEAALLAVRKGREAVEQSDFEEAVERVVAGLEKKNRVLNKMERERVAHHEVGHAITSLLLSTMDEVHKISIIPRGISALGYTMQRPIEDRFLMTKAELEAKIAVLLAGRAAEQLVFGDVSTGAQDDLAKATEIARAMVKSYGMSEALGHQSFAPPPRPNYIDLGDRDRHSEYAAATLACIDAEVRRITDEQYLRVKALLAEREAPLRNAARLLLERETVTGADLKQILDQRKSQSADVAA